jgi:hypothetical protein
VNVPEGERGGKRERERERERRERERERECRGRHARSVSSRIADTCCSEWLTSDRAATFSATSSSCAAMTVDLTDSSIASLARCSARALTVNCNVGKPE